MSRKNQDQNEAMTAVEQEEPKTKVGDAPTPTTTVDSAEKKARGAAVKSTGSFRLLDGVKAESYNGQRKTVVAAMQKLHQEQGPDKSFTLDQIVSNIEGLQSKHPVAASALWHLKGLIAAKAVEFTGPPAAEKETKETKEEVAA